MAVLQMQHISICGLKKDRKQVLELLQQSGTVEIEKKPLTQEGFGKVDTASERTVFEKNAAIAEDALEILQTYAPQKSGMLEGLKGKEAIDYEAYSSIVKRQSEVMGNARKLVSLNKSIAENKSLIQKKEDQKEALQPWKDMDLPMNYSGSKKTVAFIGTFPLSVTKEIIQDSLAAHEPKLDAAAVEIVSADKDLNYVCVIGLREQEQETEELLRSLGFARPSSVGTLTPKARLERLDRRIAELQQQNAELEKEIVAYEKDRADYRLAADYYRTRAEKYEVLGELFQSKKTFLITGYAPVQEAKKLKETLDQNFDLVVELSDPTEDEDVPVLLKNNKFSRNFEGVVASYGLPNKGEFDPTTIMSICYFFFFGMMLSDAAYGAIMFIGCLVVIKKFPNMEDGMKKMLSMFMWCGLSTLIWGILFGGYFGDFFDVVAKNWFGVELADGQHIIPPLWFEPLKEPMRLLIYSLAFGVVHLYLGLGIKAYMLIKDGKFMDAVWDVFSWFAFLTGLICMLLPSSLFYGMSGMSFPAAVGDVGKYLAIVGALVILVMSARRKKNIVLRLVMGLYDIYGVTSWLSDLLSYSRLLALGLATGVIAQVINQMGSMFGTGVLGTILFIVIFLIGTVLNLAINLLGAYVHTNRLQYVEFFGKFYEGGGRAFQPFKTNTKYVDIKEEMKL